MLKDLLEILAKVIVILAWLFTLWGIANLIVTCQGPIKPYDHNSPEAIEAQKYLDTQQKYNEHIRTY